MALAAVENAGSGALPEWMDEATVLGMVFALPILDAQIAGERQWCAWCLEVDPGQNMGLCEGCRVVGCTWQYGGAW